MQDSQTRVLLGLSAVLAALLLAMTYAPGDSSEPIDPDAVAEVWEVSAGEVVGLRVTREAGELALHRGAEGWEMTAPFGERADPGAVRRLIDGLAEVSRGVPVTPEPGLGPEAFGLADPPAYFVVLELENGEERQLNVGLTAPVGYRSYVRSKLGEIVAVQGDLARLLSVDPSELIDRRVFQFDPGHVTALTLTSPGGTLHIEKRDERWWLDGYTRVDLDALDDLVLGLLDVRVDQFVEAPAETIADPVFTVQVDSDAGERELLRVAEPGPMGALVMIGAPGGARFGFAAPQQLALLGQGPTDLGDPAALPFDPQEDELVIYQRDGLEWRAQRAAEGPWQHAGMSESEVHDVLEALDQAPIAYQREAPTGVSSGFARFEVRRGERRDAVTLGAALDGYYIAQDEAGGAAYRVPVSALSVLESLSLAPPAAGSPEGTKPEPQPE